MCQVTGVKFQVGCFRCQVLGVRFQVSGVRDQAGGEFWRRYSGLGRGLQIQVAGFDIAADPSASSLTLTVPRLMASIPEEVPQERVDLANQMLADEGIEFKYIVIDHGVNIEIVKRPEGKTDEEIYPLIWNALADQYEGPWVFTVPLQ
jgi:hypothetical protein